MSRYLVLAISLTVLSAGCAVPPASSPSAGAESSPVSSSPPGQGSVELTGRALVLEVGREVGGIRRTLATTTDEDGIPVHATLRPGAQDTDTVVLLTRVDDELGERYELRYVVATDDTVTDLYWFPWRLQVTEELVAVLDVPPVPVWAPDGSAIAWIEWTEAGTRLRTVGWIDDGESRNPSDDVTTHALDDVPPGTQLESWQVDADGNPVFLARRGGRSYRIEVSSGR